MIAAIFAAAVSIGIIIIYLRYEISLSSLLSWTLKRVIVLGQHRIIIDGRDIYSADTDALREHLEKQCTGLTSNRHNGDLTTEESLVLSLVQHYTSYYWLNSLDYASITVMKGIAWTDESKWNKFRGTLDYQSKSITSERVGELCRRFHRFWVQHQSKSSDPQIICFGLFDKRFKLLLNSNPRVFRLSESPSSSQSTTTYYLWYDRKRKCFEAITCLSNFHQDTAFYWENLMLRAECCFDQFFQREFVALSDEALESRFVQLNDEVKSIGKTFDSFKRQFEKWKVDDEFHHIVLEMEKCIQSPHQDSQDSGSAWCEQLWQVTTRCLARQIEQTFIDHKRKIEMQRRKTNSEIDKIREEVERLNWEIAKARQRINAVDRRSEDKMLGRLAWNQLLLDLANPGFVPDYNLACERRNHEIYQEKNASLLAVKVFDLIHPPSPTNQEKRASLESYVKNQTTNDQVLKELHSALDTFIGREISNGSRRNQELTIEGEASVVLTKITSSVRLGDFQKIVINAERVIYVDCDWTLAGISVTLSAPLIHIVSATGMGKRTITTSGLDGIEHEERTAADGNGAGSSGSHGLAGKDGENAGNVRIDCKNFKGLLKIVARGGKGADGQNGGNGQPGHKGYDGPDGTFPKEPTEGYCSYFLGHLRGIQLLYKSDGSPGKPGGNGGSGGNGGKGGRGGLCGQVFSDFSQFIERDCTDGQNGEDGQPGCGSTGGSGGKHGKDAVLYFEPDSLWPIIRSTGHWRSHKGSITLKEITFMEWENSMIIGYEKNRNLPPMLKRQAVDGQNGINGKRAANHLQHRSSSAAADETASRLHNHHKTGSDDNGREWEMRLEAIRRDGRQLINETKSINRISSDMDGKQNVISRYEEALAADRQRLERMDEVRQRIQSKIEETFELRIAQQSVVGQRISRQIKLNFEDGDLGLAASSVTTDLGRDIRSGRPVSEKSAVALRCLAKVDTAIRSLVVSKRDKQNPLTTFQIVQSLALKLNLDEHEKEWKYIEKIVSQNSECCDPLVRFLEFISSNLPLILSLAHQSPASSNFIEILHIFLTSTGHDQGAAEKNIICVLHEFVQRPITVQQVIALLGDVSNWTQQSNILLGFFLDKWLLSSITKTIFEVFGNDELGRASLFTKVWLRCSLVSKLTDFTVLSSDAENEEWFEHVAQFVNQLEILRHENSIAVDELLLKFCRDRLRIPQDVSEIDVEKKWQLIFIIDHFSPKVDEMDAIGQWARKKCDRHLMELVERSFKERFATPIWSHIQSLFQRDDWAEDPNSGNMKDVGEAIHQLETAILSSFTNLSFEKRLELGRAVKEKLENLEKEQKFMSNWVPSTKDFGTHDGPDLEKSQLLDWIKPLSEQVKASSAGLFISNKNADHDEVDLIISLLTITKKSKKKNEMLELHFRLSDLTASFKPNQIVKIAGILLSKSYSRPIADDFNSYHSHCFRSIFLENWGNYFFSHWSKCHQQTEHLRDVIAGRNPEDDDLSINSLELALGRYLLFTAGLLPLKAVEKWRRLQKQSSSQDRIKFIAANLNQAIPEIESTMTSRLNKLDSIKLFDLTNNGTDIGALTDVLFEIISGTTVSFFDDAELVRSLLDVIEAAQLMMDLTNEEPTGSRLISSAKFGEWKKKLDQWEVIDCGAASAVHLAVKELVETVESNFLSEDDCSRKIYNRMTARRRDVLHTFDQAISWLETFVGYLADYRSGIDTLKVIETTVRSTKFLSWNGLKNGETSLLQVAIDISTSCSSIAKPFEISWSWFFGAILNLEFSEKTTWLIMKLANFVGGQLINDRNRANWREAKTWLDRLDSLISLTTNEVNNTTPRAADGPYQNINQWEEMMSIQQVLIDYCSACYETKLLTYHENRSKNKMDLNLVWFTFKNTVERWTKIVRFVRSQKKTASSRDGNQAEFLLDQLATRKLVLKGLIKLGHSNSFYWDEESVNRFVNEFVISELEPSPEIVYILSEMLGGARKAFVERWISLENCWGPERICALEKALRDKTCSLNDAKLFFSIAGYDIFNDEEKSYLDLIGDNPAVERSLLVNVQHPSYFLGALQKLAIERIRAEFVRCFEPSVTERDIERYLPKPNRIGDYYSQEALADKPHIIQLCRSFHRLIRRKKEEGDKLRDWLLWIRDVVVPSLKSYEAHQGLSVQQITKFFEDVGEYPLDLCRFVTTGCRPHQWDNLFAIFAIKNLLDELDEKCREDQGHTKSSDIIQELIQWWPSSGAPTSFLYIFYQKIQQEMTGDPLQLMKLVQEVTNKLTALNLQSLPNITSSCNSFSSASLIYWPSVLRWAQLVVDWTPDLALRLTSVLDVQFGQQRTDHFLRLVVHRYPELKNKSGDKSDIIHLENILKNLIRYPWIKDRLITLIDDTLNEKSTEVEDSIWKSLSDSDTIEEEMRKRSQTDLGVEDILDLMSQDSESSKVIGDSSHMAQRITRIRQAYKVNAKEIKEWTQEIKDQSSSPLEVDDFLAFACQVVHDEKGYVPRDVQLIAVAVFASSDDRQDGRMPRRMGEISTGEGKTLISALVAIYHVLRHWNEDRHVNIITSSSVLAEANIAEIGWLFKAFGVSVSNNCDQQCSNNEDIRRDRYNNDVIYGDLGSFMRDILLTRFFEDKDVTRNRNPGAIIVDEVDSLTLDKGENVLYMSHNIPEMYDLLHLFVQIWTIVNAPDVVRLAESSDIVDEIRQLIEPIIPTCVPDGMKKFAERHLPTWIRSAFRACYLLLPNDAYKVDDCDDGQGRRIVIMDKETGVEQVQTEWSDGLQQFLQLKHGMKWTPISLKAIFMSNIGYFSEFEGRMYGLTGTLGSTAECDLLRKVFSVDFFRLPRFRQRFCVQHEPIIAHDRHDWLHQIQQVVVSVTSICDKNQERAVLVVCENIESADSIYDHLKSSDQTVKVIKYVSSFDEAFKEHQQQEIGPGQVIIATNLAGRGMDLKLSKELLNNGGLHLIIGFVPPNARVEAQAEGRTARAGQPGSFQFVIEMENDENPRQSNPNGDPYGRMLQLKSKRDDNERRRLDNIRQEALPKIKLEEKLFQSFYEKSVRPLEQIEQQHLRAITRNCLNNRWALWLDANSGLIEKAHRDPVFDTNLNDSFDHLTLSVQSLDVESIVSSPSEWMMLARFYEDSSLPDRAAKCYQKVTSMEPNWSENALLDCARLVLSESAGFEKKKEAKDFLKRARKLIDNRIEVLTSLYQQIDQCLNRQMERGSALCHKRFEEQVTNQIRLWRIHASKIDNLLGVPLQRALAAVLPIENDQHIDQVIELLGKCHFVKQRRYSRKTGESSFNWPPFVAHCREPLMDLVKRGNCELSDFEDAIGKVERNLWKSLISVYINEGQEAGGDKIIQGHQCVEEIPETIIPKGYRRILPGWLKYHDGQDFTLVSSTLGIEDSDKLNELEKWLESEKLLQVADKCFHHRILKPIPSMDQDPDVQLVEGVALSSCADVVATWFSSPIVKRNGNQYVLQPQFDERKKKLTKLFLDYLVDMGVVKNPAIKFLSAKSERSREDIQEDLDEIKSTISSLDGFDKLAELFYSQIEAPDEEVKSRNPLEKIFNIFVPSAVSSFLFSFANETSAAVENVTARFRISKEAKALKEKRDKLSAALTQVVGIHLGQLKILAEVNSSFCSLYAAIPPPGDDQVSATDEVTQFNNQHLDRVLIVEENVSRWNWRIGVVALIGVAQLVGAIAFPFFSVGLIGEGISDLMFAFQHLLSPGFFSWSSYFVEKGKSLALTAVTMGLGAARLVKACGGSLKQAGKLMFRFNGTLKLWLKAGKNVLLQCANIISSSIIGQVVSRFLTWLNKFILEQVLERIKSFVFNNSFLRPAFTQLNDTMRSLMKAIVDSGASAGEASQKIRQILNKAKQKLAVGDWFTELRANSASITSRMMRIFHDSTAGLTSLQGSFVGEYQEHASTGNTEGITAAANAGTIEKAISIGKTIFDYGQKATEVTYKISELASSFGLVTKLATHSSDYVGDLNAALQDELRALKNQQQGQHPSTGQNVGALSVEEKKRFEEFVAETEGEIQSEIMKTTLDTIQQAWLQPMIQLKVERTVSKIGSKLVQKYCPSLLPEGFGKSTDQYDSKNIADNEKIPSDDQWIDEMGNGKLAGPIEMQNSVDACGFVLQLEDKTDQYIQPTEGNNFTYYPEGNPYSDKPVIKMSFTQNEDGSQHVRLTMPDGTTQEYVSDPSEPPSRCFFGALSKAQNDPSVDHTINKLKNHARGNDRVRFMSNLGVDRHYQHLQGGAYRITVKDGDKTRIEYDRLGRPVRIITTETDKKYQRNPKKKEKIKGQLGFQEGDEYGHIISLNSGGVNEDWNISRMTYDCNHIFYREHEKNFEKFRDKIGSQEVITRVISIHYEHTVENMMAMSISDRENKNLLFKAGSYNHDFYTGPRENPTNMYLSGSIPNWNSKEAANALMKVSGPQLTEILTKKKINK